MSEFDTKKPLVGLIKTINRNKLLTAQEKVVGTTLALAYIWDYGFVRLSVATIVDRTGIARRTVDRALRGLVDKKVCTKKRTGRATIYTFTSSVQSSAIVDAPNRRNRYAKSDMSEEEWHTKHDDEMSTQYLKGS